MSDLDNEETYFTRRQNGAIKDEDVEKAIESIKKQIKVFGLKEPNYDTGIWLSQIHIQTILNELKYREAKYKEVLKGNNSLMQSRKKWRDRFYKSIKKLDKKNKIIDKLLMEITAVNSGRYEYMDNNEVLEIFTKKAEETDG